MEGIDSKHPQLEDPTEHFENGACMLKEAEPGTIASVPGFPLRLCWGFAGWTRIVLPLFSGPLSPLVR